jgi:hypothetical protein
MEVWVMGINNRLPGVVAACALGVLPLAGANAVADESASGVSYPTVVYLDDATLAKLRTTNPNHYARAQKIFAAARELCKPGPPEVTFAKSDARDVSCSKMLLRTSNPPKREITFRLDDTRYIALVAMTEDPPRLVNAR